MHKFNLKIYNMTKPKPPNWPSKAPGKKSGGKRENNPPKPGKTPPPPKKNK